MKIRGSLRTAVAVAVGALLLVATLASPAMAWTWSLSATAVCADDGTVKVDWTVASKEEGGEGAVTVKAVVNGEPFGSPVTGQLGPGHETVSGSFNVPADTESAQVQAKVLWKGKNMPESKKTMVELPSDCGPSPTTTTTATTAPPTTAPPTTAPTTTGGGQLPFTGANSGPLLLAVIALVGGGFVILWASRLRGRHEAK